MTSGHLTRPGYEVESSALLTRSTHTLAVLSIVFQAKACQLVVCCVVSDSCTQWYSHTREQLTVNDLLLGCFCVFCLCLYFCASVGFCAYCFIVLGCVFAVLAKRFAGKCVVSRMTYFCQGNVKPWLSRLELGIHLFQNRTFGIIGGCSCSHLTSSVRALKGTNSSNILSCVLCVKYWTES